MDEGGEDSHEVCEPLCELMNEMGAGAVSCQGWLESQPTPESGVSVGNGSEGSIQPTPAETGTHCAQTGRKMEGQTLGSRKPEW